MNQNICVLDWHTEKAALLQRIELLQITITQMKDREDKMKRVNQTLLNSLSNSSDSANHNNSLVKQQSAEIARLHEKLEKKRSQYSTSLYNRSNLTTSESPVKSESSQIKQLSARNQELLMEISRMKEQHRNQICQIQERYENQLRSLHPKQEELKSELCQSQISISSFNKPTAQKPANHLLDLSRINGVNMNMNGYINFIKYNECSINCRLLKQKYQT